MSVDAANSDLAWIGLSLACLALLACSQVGRVLSWWPNSMLSHWQPRLLALAAGGLLCELLSQAWEALQTATTVRWSSSAWLVLGFALVAGLDALFRHRGNRGVPQRQAGLSLASDGLHNFADGLLIGAAFAVDASMGVAMAFAVFVHELAQELGDLGLLLTGSRPLSQALRLNLLAALPVIPGALLGFASGQLGHDWAAVALPLSSGSLAYLLLIILLPSLLGQIDTPKATRVRWFAFGAAWVLMAHIWHPDWLPQSSLAMRPGSAIPLPA